MLSARTLASLKANCATGGAYVVLAWLGSPSVMWALSPSAQTSSSPRTRSQDRRRSGRGPAAPATTASAVTEHCRSLRQSFRRRWPRDQWSRSWSASPCRPHIQHNFNAAAAKHVSRIVREMFRQLGQGPRSMLDEDGPYLVRADAVMAKRLAPASRRASRRE